MPTYKYECEFCGHRFKEFQQMSEEKLVNCPECKKDTLKRMIGAGFNVILKGAGFYTNDYAKPKPPTNEGNK